MLKNYKNKERDNLLHYCASQKYLSLSLIANYKKKKMEGKQLRKNKSYNLVIALRVIVFLKIIVMHPLPILKVRTRKNDSFYNYWN